jgi:hypothetical protein
MGRSVIDFAELRPTAQKSKGGEDSVGEELLAEAARMERKEEEEQEQEQELWGCG